MKTYFHVVVGVSLGLCPFGANAHAFLTPAKAAPGAPVILAIGLDHACGDDPTTSIRVRVPEGFVTVLPFPKAGWEIVAVEERYEQPQGLGTIQLRAGVVELQWTGGPLEQGYYDEFRFRGQLSSGVEPGSVLYFPVVQECRDGGVHRWIAIADEGQPVPEEPAPALATVPPGSRH